MNNQLNEWLDNQVAPLIEAGFLRRLLKTVTPSKEIESWSSIEDAMVASVFSNLARIGRSVKGKHQVIPALKRIAKRVSAEMKAEVRSSK